MYPIHWVQTRSKSVPVYRLKREPLANRHPSLARWVEKAIDICWCAALSAVAANTTLGTTTSVSRFGLVN